MNKKTFYRLACKAIEANGEKQEKWKNLLSFSDEEKEDVKVLFSMNENEEKVMNRLLNFGRKKWKILSEYLADVEIHYEEEDLSWIKGQLFAIYVEDEGESLKDYMKEKLESIRSCTTIEQLVEEMGYASKDEMGLCLAKRTLIPVI